MTVLEESNLRNSICSIFIYLILIISGGFFPSNPHSALCTFTYFSCRFFIINPKPGELDADGKATFVTNMLSKFYEFDKSDVKDKDTYVTLSTAAFAINSLVFIFLIVIEIC